MSWLSFEYLRNSLVEHELDELEVFDCLVDEIVNFVDEI